MEDPPSTFPDGTTPRERHNVVFVLGPPGSGKGTQCQRIERGIGFIHLSAGELLREERQRPGSEFGELIEGHMVGGTIVPVRITCSLLERAMAGRRGAKGFLVDGFPRNRDNLDGWTRQMTEKVRELCVLFINAPIEVCVQRCLRRGQGRSDDNEESIRRRIVTYNAHTMPIIDHYSKLNMVREIDAGEKNEDEVYALVEKIFKEFNFTSTPLRQAGPNQAVGSSSTDSGAGAGANKEGEANAQ